LVILSNTYSQETRYTLELDSVNTGEKADLHKHPTRIAILAYISNVVDTVEIVT